MNSYYESEGKIETRIAEDCYKDWELLAISEDDFNLDDDCILNTACTFHTCPYPNLFSIYETVSKGVVVM